MGPVDDVMKLGEALRLSIDLTVQAYPVIVEASDVIVAALPVVVIGLLTASVASGFARSRTRIR